MKSSMNSQTMSDDVTIKVENPQSLARFRVRAPIPEEHLELFCAALAAQKRTDEETLPPRKDSLKKSTFHHGRRF